MTARCLLLVLFPLVSCGTVRDWRELDTSPMTLGECFDGIVHVASGTGFAADQAASDRGMGVWQSKWRPRVLDNRHPGRFRLRVEVLVEEGSAATGWPLRYAVEQQKVDDLRRSVDPREEDWSGDGQDREKEAILGEALVRRLVRTRPASPPRRAP